MKSGTRCVGSSAYDAARTIHQILDLLRELRLTNGLRKQLNPASDGSPGNSGAATQRRAAQCPKVGVLLVGSCCYGRPYAGARKPAAATAAGPAYRSSNYGLWGG